MMPYRSFVKLLRNRERKKPELARRVFEVFANVVKSGSHQGNGIYHHSDYTRGSAAVLIEYVLRITLH